MSSLLPQFIKDKCRRKVYKEKARQEIYERFRDSSYIPETFGYERFTLAIKMCNLKITIWEAFL